MLVPGPTVFGQTDAIESDACRFFDHFLRREAAVGTASRGMDVEINDHVWVRSTTGRRRGGLDSPPEEAGTTTERIGTVSTAADSRQRGVTDWRRPRPIRAGRRQIGRILFCVLTAVRGRRERVGDCIVIPRPVTKEQIDISDQFWFECDLRRQCQESSEAHMSSSRIIILAPGAEAPRSAGTALALRSADINGQRGALRANRRCSLDATYDAFGELLLDRYEVAEIIDQRKPGSSRLPSGRRGVPR